MMLFERELPNYLNKDSIIMSTCRKKGAVRFLFLDFTVLGIWMLFYLRIVPE